MYVIVVVCLCLYAYRFRDTFLVVKLGGNKESESQSETDRRDHETDCSQPCIVIGLAPAVGERVLFRRTEPAKIEFCFRITER